MNSRLLEHCSAFYVLVHVTVFVFVCSSALSQVSSCLIMIAVTGKV